MEEYYYEQLKQKYKNYNEINSDKTNFGVYISYQIQQKNIEKIKQLIELKGFTDINEKFYVNGKNTTILNYSMKMDLGVEFIKYLMINKAEFEGGHLSRNVRKVIHLENYMDYIKVIFTPCNIKDFYWSNVNPFRKIGFEYIKNVDFYFNSVIHENGWGDLWNNTPMIHHYIDYLKEFCTHEKVNTHIERKKLLDTISQILNYMKYSKYDMYETYHGFGPIEQIVNFIIDNRKCCLFFCKNIIYELLYSGVDFALKSKTGRKKTYIYNPICSFESDEEELLCRSLVKFPNDTKVMRYLFIKDLCENWEKHRDKYWNRFLSHNIFDLNIYYDDTDNNDKYMNKLYYF